MKPAGAPTTAPATPGKTMVGLRGPGGIRLYSTRTVEAHNAINEYLRLRSGYRPKIREIAILTVAREMDSQFEWAAHEPEALKARRGARDHRRHQVPQEHHGPRRNRRGDHRIRPADFSRSQGHVRGLCADEGAVQTAEQARRAGLLMGNYAGDGGAALRLRHAGAGRQAATAAAYAFERAFPLAGAGNRFFVRARVRSSAPRTASMSFCSGHTVGGKRAPPRSGSGS